MNEQRYKSSLKPTNLISTLSLISFLLLTAGNLQAGMPDSHQRMVDLLQQVRTETIENNSYFGFNLADRLGHQLASLPEEAPLRRRWELTFQLAQAELNLGREEKAVLHFTDALKILQASDHISSAAVTGTQFYLGVAHIRMAETQNCCLRHTADSCILPLRGGAIHTQQDPSRNAIPHLTRVVKSGKSNNPFYLKAIWLLNLAYMTVDEYPDSVPADFLIPPETFVSEETIPRFRDIAPELGLDTFDLSGGAIADDFDNDGYLDLFVSTWDPSGQIHFFHNNQDGTFSEQTAEVGLTGLYGGLNLVQADYDNDGDIDVLVLRGAWLGQYGRHPNSLLRNNGPSSDGWITFTDVTFDAGLGEVHYPTQSASWADYDNDGDLDLYIGNEANQLLSDAPNQLFRNNGDGTFTDIAVKAGVQDFGPTKAVIWGDYNHDRLPDIYVSNLGDANRLYHNNGDDTFTDLAGELGVMGFEQTFPAWFWDINNDGLLDLYVSSYTADIGVLAADARGLSVAPEALPQLYLGTETGFFEEVARQYNLVHPTSPMGSNFGDLDNDGYLDFYLGTGNPDLWNVMPGMMYRNKSGKYFAEVSYAGGFANIQKGHGIIFADFDNDGDQDVFEQMGGAFPADKYSNVLYENKGFGNHWLTIHLVGTESNRAAIGARIRVQVIEDGVRRSIFKHVNSGGTFGANPLRQTIGLGQATEVEELEIFWPTTGKTQTIKGVATDQFIQITEGQPGVVPISLKRLKLGGEPSD